MEHISGMSKREREGGEGEGEGEGEGGKRGRGREGGKGGNFFLAVKRGTLR